MSIRLKLTLLVVGLAALPTILVGIGVVLNVRATVRAQFRALAIDDLDHLEDQLRLMVDALRADGRTARSLVGRRDPGGAEVAELLRTFVSSRSYARAFVIGPDGELVTEYTRGAHRARALPGPVLAQSLSSEETSVFPVRALAGVSAQSEGTTLAVAAALFRAPGAEPTILVLELGAEALLDVFRRTSSPPGEVSAVVTGDGHFLFHSARDTLPYSLLPAPREARLSAQFSAEESAQILSGRPGELSAGDRMVVYRPVALLGEERLIAYEMVSRRALLAPALRLEWRLTWGIAAVLMVGLLLSALMAARWTRPLIQLRDATRALASGQWTPFPEVRTNDEVQDLAADFGTMGREVEDRRRHLEQLVGELTAAQAGLRENEAKYRTLFEQTPDAVVVIDPATTLPVAFNDKACEQLGYSREEFSRLRISDYEAVETPEETRAHVRQVLQARGSEFEVVQRTKQGELRNILVSTRPVEIAGRELLHTMFRDVTARHTAMAALRRSEERYRTLIENANDTIWIMDLDGKLTFLNRQGELVTGYRSEELKGRPFATLIHPDEVERVNEALGELRAGQPRQLLVRFIKRDGEQLILSANAAPVRDGDEVVGVVGFGRDVTEQRRMEEALQGVAREVSRATGEEFFRSLVAHLGGALGVEHAFIAELTGTDDSRARTIARWVRGDIAENIEYALEGTPCADVVQRHLCIHPSGVRDSFPRDRDLVDLGVESYGGTPLFGSTGKVLGVMAVMGCKPLQHEQLVASLLQIFAVRAASEMERLRTEEALRQAQKMEVVGQFAGGMAHDFNNLLATILATTELMAKELPAESTLRNDVREIRQASERGAELIRKVLAFSRRQQLELRLVKLGRLIRESAGLIRRVVREDVEFQIAVEEEATVRADAGAVEQIVMNLVTNARDAMPGGGTLTIRTERRSLNQETCDSWGIGTPGDYVLLSVTDSGVGMSPEIQRHLSEPFFTTKPAGRGTGLGMAMIFGLARQHGGFLRVQSRLGCGTTVEVYFPRVDDVPAELAETGSAVRSPQGTETILLVEDEPALARVARRVLEKQGYGVLAAADGIEALELFHAHEAEIGLILTDVILPRLSGPQFVARLREEGKGVKVLFTTGYAAGELEAGILAPGVAVIPKPWQIAELLERVRESLDA